MQVVVATGDQLVILIAEELHTKSEVGVGWAATDSSAALYIPQDLDRGCVFVRTCAVSLYNEWVFNLPVSCHPGLPGMPGISRRMRSLELEFSPNKATCGL